jgi:ribosomal protein S27E
MARFNDFDRQELAVIKSALEWAESEYYDPGHTQEDRDLLDRLIREARVAAFTEPEPDLVITAHKFAPAEPQRLEFKATIEPGPEPATAPPLFGKAIKSTRATPEEMEDTRGKDEQPAENRRERPEPQAGGYTGFLYVECEHCGDIHGFCAKRPLQVYRCEKCGGRTPLEDLKRLRVVCECGGKFGYNTNMTAGMTDVACFKCGNPVSVEWSERRQRYQPIGFGPGRKGRKR